MNNYFDKFNEKHLPQEIKELEKYACEHHVPIIMKDSLLVILALMDLLKPKRILEIQEMTKHVTAGKIFVTAFPDIATYKKFSSELAWETEVWLSDAPDHMIHLNGDKFLGPR